MIHFENVSTFFDRAIVKHSISNNKIFLILKIASASSDSRGQGINHFHTYQFEYDTTLHFCDKSDRESSNSILFYFLLEVLIIK